MKPPTAFSFRGQRALILRVPVRLLHNYGPGTGSEQDGDDQREDFKITAIGHDCESP